MYSLKLILTLFVSLIFFTFCTISFATTTPLSIRQLEASSEGRIGVYAINTGNGDVLHYRANERFPMGCTSKVIGVGAILASSMKDKALLSQKIHYSKQDLVNWNPITKKHIATGMTVIELCEAAISYSDNTAMNLLLIQLGGLENLNAFAKKLNNTSFRQDHEWPEEAYSGGAHNVHDSSTPKDMVTSLQRLLLTKTLAEPQKKHLTTWLKNNTTGDARIRAGVPKNWVVGDKTGSGALYGTTNDLGIIWPPQCAPILLGIYYTSDNKTAKAKQDLIASITHEVISELSKKDECLRKNL